ncbi:transposase [Granulicella cerasi]|uniref:Transposase n=1 Tax=Granulicella cerasi TaxID=741063 RepID=A0ABW1ZAJ2_9BACT|nr:transposase [Granulicella cerasi]
MTRGLERRYGGGHHFITFSCHSRKPYLATPQTRDIFLHCLEKIRSRYEFRIDSFVVMPEHVHMLVTEPKVTDLSVVMRALKLSVTQQVEQSPFWLPRFHDFNVLTDTKVMEKRRYIHRNPVSRGLVTRPEDWAWSSYRHWLSGEVGVVEVESTWTFAKRMADQTFAGR